MSEFETENITKIIGPILRNEDKIEVRQFVEIANEISSLTKYFLEYLIKCSVIGCINKIALQHTFEYNTLGPSADTLTRIKHLELFLRIKLGGLGDYLETMNVICPHHNMRGS